MRIFIKNYTFIKLLILSSSITPGERYDIDNYQAQKQAKTDALHKQQAEETKENRAREQAEKDALDKEFKKNKSDLEKERNDQKQHFKTRIDRILATDPHSGKKNVVLNNESDVDNLYNEKLKKLQKDHEAKRKELDQKNLDKLVSLREKQQQAVDDLSSEFEAFESKKPKNEKPKDDEPKTKMGKDLKAIADHVSNMKKIDEKYDYTIETLEKKYEKDKDDLLKKMGIKSKLDSDKVYNKETKKYEQISPEAQKDLQNKLKELTKKFGQDKQEALDTFHTERDQLLNKTNDAFDKNSKESTRIDEKALQSDLKKATPKTIDNVVEQFSKEVIPNLSKEQKESLRDIISSIQKQSEKNISFEDIIKNNKNDFINKLHLTKDQIDTFNKNYTERAKQTIKDKGFFDGILEFLRNLFSKPIAQNNNKKNNN